MNSAKRILLIASLGIALNASYYGEIAKAATLDQAYKLYLSGDIQGGEQLYSLAVTALENNPDKLHIITEFDYKCAALLINQGEYGKALKILERYVFTNNANVRMQSDYLDALSRLGQYKKLVISAQKFWHKNYQHVPNYGVLLVADSLFKLKKYSEAEPLYTLVLERDSNHLYANLSLAYCLAMRNKAQAALAIYEKCYTLQSNSEDVLLAEAQVLFNGGNRRLANKLYAFLTTTSTNPDKIRLSKAKALSKAGYTISSNKMLDSISTAGKGSDYLTIKFLNKLDAELYWDAAQNLNSLQNTPAYSNLKRRYEQARRGGLSVAFLTTSNYKGNSSQTYRADGDAYLGLNTYLTASLDTTRLSDKVNLATVTTSTLGLTHRFERGKIYANLSNAVSGNAHSLYNSGLSFKLDDLTAIGFDFGRRYIGDSKAVLHSFIIENYYSISLSHKLNQKNVFWADYTQSSITDGNNSYNYSFSYSYYPIKSANKTHELYTYYRRGGFSTISPYYESPNKRIAYGLGWQAQWTQSNGAYWILRLKFELGHDNLEPTDWSPGIRVQYTQPLAKNQELSLAVEYGVRTNKLNHINSFMHGYKQFEIRYNLNW